MRTQKERMETYLEEVEQPFYIALEAYSKLAFPEDGYQPGKEKIFTGYNLCNQAAAYFIHAFNLKFGDNLFCQSLEIPLHDQKRLHTIIGLRLDLQSHFFDPTYRQVRPFQASRLLLIREDFKGLYYPESGNDIRTKNLGEGLGEILKDIDRSKRDSQSVQKERLAIYKALQLV